MLILLIIVAILSCCIAVPSRITCYKCDVHNSYSCNDYEGPELCTHTQICRTITYQELEDNIYTNKTTKGCVDEHTCVFICEILRKQYPNRILNCKVSCCKQPYCNKSQNPATTTAITKLAKLANSSKKLCIIHQTFIVLFISIYFAML